MTLPLNRAANIIGRCARYNTATAAGLIDLRYFSQDDGVRVTGHSGAADNVKMYNCTLFRLTPKAIYFYDYGNLEMKNCAVIDSPIVVVNAGSHQVFTETNNFYGLSRLGSINQSQLVIAPDATDVWEAGDSGYSIGAYDDLDGNSLQLLPGAASPAINAGTALGFDNDMDGHPIVATPDLGAYETDWIRLNLGGAGGLSMEFDMGMESGGGRSNWQWVDNRS